MSLASKITRPSGLTIRDVRGSKSIPAYGSPSAGPDVATAALVFDELLQTVRTHGVAALIATHNPDLAARMDRTVTLRDGHIEAL